LLCVRPNGSRNSATRISPSLAGLRSVIDMKHLADSRGYPDIRSTLPRDRRSRQCL
jgi:hypothetical protein